MMHTKYWGEFGTSFLQELLTTWCLFFCKSQRASTAISEFNRPNFHRLYGCLRIAMGWIIFHIRSVDDGRYRRSVCESLCVCYMLQALAVLRAQFTDRKNTINWIAIVLLLAIGTCYGRFRFGKGGSMIKVYELPISDKTIRWHITADTSNV